MILRLVICSSLLAAGGNAACVKGTIALTEVKGEKKAPLDLSDTVVWLEPLSDAPVAPRRLAEKPRIIQKNKTFQPHVLAIPVGTSVDFPNFDPIFHNAFSNYNGQIFDVGLYPPGSSRSVAFRREGIVRVFCNIHSFMSAVIVVLRSPYYAISGADGAFEIDDVPKGNYRLQFYHERATEQTLASLSRELKVNSPIQQVGTINISESGYLPIPHLNKFGKAYGNNPDATSYPGARQ